MIKALRSGWTFIIVAFFLFLFTGQVVLASGGTVFIDANGNGTLDSGELFFSTIQDAITAASSGDTIVIGAGTYTVTTTMAISKTLNLRGDGSYPQIFFNVTADNVTFKNLEIYSPVSPNGTRSNYAITYTSGSGLFVDDVKFHDIKRALYVVGGNTFTVQNSEMSFTNREMISIGGGGTGAFTITHNWIHDSSFLGGSSSGVVIIRDNLAGGVGEISYNYIEGTRVAILYDPATANAPTSGSFLIAHNTIDNTWTSTTSYYGANILTPSYNTQGIGMYDPAGRGLNSAAITIRDNIIMNTRLYGTHYNGGATGVLHGNLPITNSLYWNNYWDAAASGETPAHYANEWSGTATNPQIAWQGGAGGDSISPNAETKTLDPLFAGGVKVTAASYYALGSGSPACSAASDGQNIGAWQGTCPQVPSVSTPTPAPSVRRPATITVVKVVINDNGRTKAIADFPLFVNGTSVASGVTGTFPSPAGVYTVSEEPDINYTRTFSGDCDVNGRLNLVPGDNKFCIITNDDIAGVPGLPNTGIVPPLMNLVKVANPLALPNGPGPVMYTYTLRNIGTIPVADVTMVGDSCSPVTLVSGDSNHDSKLDVNETWTYSCATTLDKTTTNTVTASGLADGISTVDIATATVIVGAPIIPPLIHVTKVPNPLVLSGGGGMVTYTNIVTNPGVVPLTNVRLTDDTCSSVKYISGDTNRDSKLDSAEAWTYTCSANLTQTTTNTVIAVGEANGITQRDLAIVTVVVAVPAFPNTGLPSASNSGQQVKTIAVNIGTGDRNTNVKILQQFLISQNKGPAAQALAKVGATSFFGVLTQKALAEFQVVAGIRSALGFFGPVIQAYMRAH